MFKAVFQILLLSFHYCRGPATPWLPVTTEHTYKNLIKVVMRYTAIRVEQVNSEEKLIIIGKSARHTFAIRVKVFIESSRCRLFIIFYPEERCQSLLNFLSAKHGYCNCKQDREVAMF